MSCGLAALLSVACEEARAPGQLVVSFESDMALPQQLDSMQIAVLSNGRYLLDHFYALGQAHHRLPATLTLVAGEDSSTPVTVRLAGKKQSHFRTYRELTTVVPSDRSVLMHMPLQWLCDETASERTEMDSTGQSVLRPGSTCDEGFACRAGECLPIEIDNASLPPFSGKSVFGGEDDPLNGACYDTLSCMASGSSVQPDADCTIAQPSQGAFNVALRVPNGGICDRGGTLCLVPLDGESDEGFSIEGERVRLPRAVCTKLRQGFIDDVYVSTACAMKTPAHPPCGIWSSVPDDHAITPEPSGAGTGNGPVTPALITTVPAAEGVCCPLLQDSGKFYTCACDSMTNASIYELPMTFGSPRRLGSINPSSKRPSLFFAASVHKDALYWVGENELQRTPLAAGVQAFTIEQTGLYWSASLLADERAVYALASGVPNAPSAVQVLVIGHDRSRLPMLDTGSSEAVFQFGQDAAAIYLASDIDNPAANGGGMFERVSQVVRIRKQDGARGDVLPLQRLMIADAAHGGYVGVQVAGSLVSALFEGAPGMDGMMRVEVLRVDVSNLANLPAPDRLYVVTIDPSHTKLGLLGAVDDHTFLSRVEFDESGKARSSAVIALGAPGAAQQILASYEADTQVAGLVADETRMYWLNQSGRLYAFPRSGLR